VKVGSYIRAVKGVAFGAKKDADSVLVANVNHLARDVVALFNRLERVRHATAMPSDSLCNQGVKKTTRAVFPLVENPVQSFFDRAKVCNLKFLFELTDFSVV
jgi:hypothetical protein